MDFKRIEFALDNLKLKIEQALSSLENGKFLSDDETYELKQSMLYLSGIKAEYEVKISELTGEEALVFSGIEEMKNKVSEYERACIDEKIDLLKNILTQFLSLTANNAEVVKRLQVAKEKAVEEVGFVSIDSIEDNLKQAEPYRLFADAAHGDPCAIVTDNRQLLTDKFGTDLVLDLACGQIYVGSVDLSLPNNDKSDHTNDESSANKEYNDQTIDIYEDENNSFENDALTVPNAGQEEKCDETGVLKWDYKAKTFGVSDSDGDFFRKTRSGRTLDYDKRKRLILLNNIYLLRVVSYYFAEKTAGSTGVEWLFNKGYTATVELPVSGIKVVKVTKKGKDFLESGKIRGYAKGLNFELTSIIKEQFDFGTENKILKTLAISDAFLKLQVDSYGYYSRLDGCDFMPAIRFVGMSESAFTLGLCSIDDSIDECENAIKISGEGKDFENDTYYVAKCSLNEMLKGDAIVCISVNNGAEFKYKLTDEIDNEQVKEFLSEIPKYYSDTEISDDDNLDVDSKIETKEDDDGSVVSEEDSDVNNFEENKPVDANDASEYEFDSGENNTEGLSNNEIETVDFYVEKNEDDNTARYLARKLMDEQSCPKDSVIEYTALADRLVCEQRSGVALALMYSLRKDGAEYENYYECLKSAIGFGFDKIEENPANLPVADCEPRRRLAFQACAFIRSLIKSEDINYTVLSGARELLKYDWEEMSTCKKAYDAVIQTLNAHHCGFSSKLLVRLESKEKRDKLLIDCISEAKELMRDSSWRPNDESSIFHEAFGFAFGPESKMHNLLECIVNNDKTAYKKVEEFLKPFYTKNGGIDNKKVQDFRYDIWEKCNGNEKLTSRIGNNFDKKCTARLELLNNWLDLVNSLTDKQKTEGLVKAQETLISLFKAASSIDNTFESALFAQTSINIVDYLSLNNKNNNIFEEFIFSDSVSLDDGTGLPLLDNYSEEIDELRAYYAIIKHICYIDEHKKDASLIKERCDQDNYFMAHYIAKALNSEWQEFSEKRYALARNEFRDAYGDICADLDMAYTRGLIDTDFLSKRLKEAENIYGIGDKTRNYGLYKNLFKYFKRAVDSSAALKEHQLNERLIRLQNESDDNDLPILDSIRSQMQAKNYTVAEEYLTRAESGEKDVDDTQVDEFDAHADFLNKYDALYAFCQKYDGKMLDKMALDIGDVITEKNREALKLPTTTQNKDIKDGVTWLRALPNEKWLQTDINHNSKFLELLNYNVISRKKIKSAIADFIDEYTISPIKQNLPVYAHPISRFGTNIDKLMLFYINGKRGETIGELIKNRQSDFTSGRAVIIYLDSVLKKETRRKIAKDIKTQQLPQTFLVIDRVLAVYIAFTQQAKRLSSLLKCTMPYTDFNPYCTNGAGEVHSEMFVGRKHERNEISNMDSNTCLICGGRQLGKTVLLERVRQTMHDPVNKKYAIYTGTRGNGTVAVLEDTVKKLTECGMISKNEQIKSWSELCEKLILQFKANRYTSLMLVIDEGDAFIEEQRKLEYKDLESLYSVRKQTNKSFKFVLAGLHNISRESHDPNSFLAQLGSPLIIKPFSIREARELVEIPLLYLGYKFEQPDKLLPLILSHTNYYPGLLHLFCSDLITYLSSNFNTYFNEVKNPPYTVTEEHVKAVVTSTGFKSRVKDTFDITLNVQSARYKKIAIALAILYLEHPSCPGYTVNQIKEYADMAYVDDLTAYHNLLTEMCDLGMIAGILANDNNTVRYIFLRNAFFGYVCGVDAVGRRDKGEQVDSFLTELEKIGKEIGNV